VATRGTDNPAAYDAYLRGLRLLSARRRLDTEANAAAQAVFEEAIRLDPDYALAYAGLGWTKWLYYESINYNDSPDSAFALAEKSLALAENALAHRTLAKRHFALFSDEASARNIDQAVVELEAARRLQPSDPDVLADLATALPFSGRPEEALELIRQAKERNPDHPDWYYAASGIAYLLTEQDQLAIRDLQRWSESAPNWHVPYLFLAAAYGLDGQAEAGEAAFDRHSSLLYGTGMTLYALKREWPMGAHEEEIFVRGLRAVGAKDTPG
jgi:tetratricopeptide (TPR) repeat protein